MHQKRLRWIGLASVLGLFAGTTRGALVAYYTLNEGEGMVAADASGNGHDGAIQGVPTWVDGPPGFGKALFFDGSNPATGWVNCGTWNPSAGTGQLTVALWIKWQGTNGVWQGVVGKRDGWDPASNPPMMWYVEMNAATGAIGFQMRDRYPPNGGTPPVGQWVHTAFTFDGTTVRTYVDGELIGSGAFTLGTRTNALLTIGCDNGGGYNGFNGAIDEVRLYDTALAQGDIQRLLTAEATTSWSPSPFDGATDVPRETLLTWSPGDHVAAHDVYFGPSLSDVNTASRTDQKGVLVSQGQTDLTYDPVGLLDFGQTYYWRVDEVNVPPNPTISRGSIWDFTVEPYMYAIRPRAATASTSYSAAYPPTRTIDGSGLTNDRHSVISFDMWLSKRGQDPTWIKYEFDAVYMLTQMWVWNSNQASETNPSVGYGAKEVTIEVSTDGTTWTALNGTYEFAQATGQSTYTHNTAVDLGGVLAKYVRLNMQSSWGGQPIYGLSEVRFFYLPVQARQSGPTSGAIDVALNTVLTWRPGRLATAHDLFFGTDSNAVANGTSQVTRLTESRIALTSLGAGYGQTYYWKVNEVNDATAASWPGAVWSFSTVEGMPVDDFEAYDDQCNRVYYAWKGGTSNGDNPDCGVGAYAGNGTGSAVGKDDPPYAERLTVHEGRQSMPFWYDNSQGPFYSEAEREWPAGQAWTGGGVNTLTVYVWGNPISFLESPPGQIVMSGRGEDIYQTTDQFRFAYKPLTGDGSITARIDSIQNTHDWAKAGVMIRASLEGVPMQAHMVAIPTNRVEWMPRTDAGANATGTATAIDSTPLPVWVRVTRTGNTFTGEYSADGVTWGAVATATPATIAMPSSVTIGLVVCSHVAENPCIAKFSSVSTTGSVTGDWLLADVGVEQLAGNTPDTFYVAVQDGSKTRVVGHPDRNVVTTGVWERWDIPLTEFTSAGIDLNSVKRLVIGVGDRNSPRAGGTGKLYIDDIRLTRVVTP